MRRSSISLVSAVLLALSTGPVAASEAGPALAPIEDFVPVTRPDGAIEWFGRCATPPRAERPAPTDLDRLLGIPADCDSNSTNPTADYDPGTAYLIEVWVHILQSNATQGAVSDARIHSQIAVLNEDFRALIGSNGENGNDSAVYFKLAGITRTTNATFFNDGGGYFNTLAVDPDNYLNIYSNNAGGNLGYVPQLPTDQAPGGSFVGSNSDRVVIYWESMGVNPGFPPYDLGRTATHEVGHYMGLEHVFSGGCGTPTPPACYTTGDLICDTNADATSHFPCTPGTTCSGIAIPIENYMEYTDDFCMEKFTVEQNRRMRCALTNYRTELGIPILFYDGFESGNLNPWSLSFP